MIARRGSQNRQKCRYRRLLLELMEDRLPLAAGASEGILVYEENFQEGYVTGYLSGQEGWTGGGQRLENWSGDFKSNNNGQNQGTWNTSLYSVPPTADSLIVESVMRMRGGFSHVYGPVDQVGHRIVQFGAHHSSNNFYVIDRSGASIAFANPVGVNALSGSAHAYFDVRMTIDFNGDAPATGDFEVRKSGQTEYSTVFETLPLNLPSPYEDPSTWTGLLLRGYSGADFVDDLRVSVGFDNAPTERTIEPEDRGELVSGGSGPSDHAKIVVSLAEAMSPEVEADFDAYRQHLDTGNAEIPFAFASLGFSIVGFESFDRLLEVDDFRGIYENPIAGTNSSQTLTGTESADLIVGYGGNDTLIGLGGNDILIGGSGNDTQDGGIGDDSYLFSGTSNGFDTLVGGDGYDQAIATGVETVIGLNGFAGSVEAILGAGDTLVEDTNSSRTLDFSNTLLDGIEEIHAGGGNDNLTASNLSAAIYRGGSGNDTLTAGDADVTWLFSEGSNGFDKFINGSGIATAVADSDGAIIGVNGYENGVDEFDAGTLQNVVIRDTNSSRTLDFSSTALTGVAEVDAGGGNDIVTASEISDASYRGGSGNDTLNASAADVIWLFNGVNNGFDTFNNGTGNTTAGAESNNTEFGINGFANGVDAFDGSGFDSVVIRDTNSSRTLDFSQTTLLGISEIDAAGGNDMIVASALSHANYRGGFGNDTLIASSQAVVWLYRGTNSGFDTFVNGTGNSKALAEVIETSIGLNGYGNGVDVIEGPGDTLLIDSNSSHLLDFSQTNITGTQRLIAGGGNDTITASNTNAMVIEGGAGNDTLVALGSDVTWIYQGTGNGFDTLINGTGRSVAEATAAGTVIGVNGFDNGADEFLGVGDTIIRDTNSSRVLDFSNTVVTSIFEIDGAGGNDTLVASTVSSATYRGGAGNDTFVILDSATTIEVTIADFNSLGNDRLDFTDFGFSSTTAFADLSILEENEDTLIDLLEQTQLRLVDLAIADLSEDDFLF